MMGARTIVVGRRFRGPDVGGGPEFVVVGDGLSGGWAIAGSANVMGWPMAAAGSRPGSRRRYAGTAMFDARGRLPARGAAIWVAPRAA
jgi:hypothetical protein